MPLSAQSIAHVKDGYLVHFTNDNSKLEYDINIDVFAITDSTTAVTIVQSDYKKYIIPSYKDAIQLNETIHAITKDMVYTNHPEISTLYGKEYNFGNYILKADSIVLKQ